IPLVVVIGSVDDGKDGARPHRSWVEAGDALWGQTEGMNSPPRGSRVRPQAQRFCLMRAVSSCTRLYTERSSRIMRAIFEVAWMTVVWSRPPNCLPILGSEESVSSRERYIATWRG